MSSFRSLSVPATARPTACRIIFDTAAGGNLRYDGTPALAVPLTTLQGAGVEVLLEGAEDPVLSEDCTIFHGAGRLAGFGMAAPETELEAAARDLYLRMFVATAGRRLYRIWNYVPHINAVSEGIENYRRFCRGRSHAFEQHFGHSFQRELPAASAVGTSSGPPAIAFLAGDGTTRHFENPQQVPAFEYPPAYGPRPPSFSRATLVTTAARRELFVSGTAAIRGHATISAEDLAGQLACTRENLHVIAATAGAGDGFGSADGWRRSVKVYLRHRRDWEDVRRDLGRHLLRAEDAVTFLQADLCRADLLVEIEAVLTKE